MRKESEKEDKCITESFYCTEETNTTLQINYISIKVFKKVTLLIMLWNSTVLISTIVRSWSASISFVQHYFVLLKVYLTAKSGRFFFIVPCVIPSSFPLFCPTLCFFLSPTSLSPLLPSQILTEFENKCPHSDKSFPAMIREPTDVCTQRNSTPFCTFSFPSQPVVEISSLYSWHSSS